MAKGYKPLADAIRQAIDESGMTRYRISKETGIGEAMIARIYWGEQDCRMSTVDKILEICGWEAQPKAKPKPKGGKQRGKP